MFSLSLIFNALVGLLALIYWVIVFVMLYHLTRFGIGTQPKKIAALLFLGSVILSSIVSILFINLDVHSLLTNLQL